MQTGIFQFHIAFTRGGGGLGCWCCKQFIGSIWIKKNIYICKKKITFSYLFNLFIRICLQSKCIKLQWAWNQHQASRRGNYSTHTGNMRWGQTRKRAYFRANKNKKYNTFSLYIWFYCMNLSFNTHFLTVITVSKGIQVTKINQKYLKLLKTLIVPWNICPFYLKHHDKYMATPPE